MDGICGCICFVLFSQVVKVVLFCFGFSKLEVMRRLGGWMDGWI